jgi:uncharacterized protein (DUF1810 family)
LRERSSFDTWKNAKMRRFSQSASARYIFLDVLPSNDPYDLDRFVRAQAADYERALSELRDGRKRSHWMWYIFPQIEGLGQSPMSHRYSIKSAAEARAYLDHPVLGPRLRECFAAVNDIVGHSALEILGSPDDSKLRSCATLFARVSDGGVFEQVLQKYFDGQHDEETPRRLESPPDPVSHI